MAKVGLGPPRRGTPRAPADAADQLRLAGPQFPGAAPRRPRAGAARPMRSPSRRVSPAERVVRESATARPIGSPAPCRPDVADGRRPGPRPPCPRSPCRLAASRRRGRAPRPPTRPPRGARMPLARNAPQRPASTSPVPPVAMPGLPVGMTQRAPSGLATTVRAPFRTTTAPHSCALRPRDRRPGRPGPPWWSPPMSRAISPGCGREDDGRFFAERRRARGGRPPR